MSSNAGKKQFYFGWWIVVTAFLIMALSFAPSQSMPGLFVAPMAEEFGVSRTVAALVSTAVTLSCMVASLPAGRILSRYNLKVLVSVTLVIQAASQFALAAAGSLTVIFIMAGVRGVTLAFCANLPASILVNNWFGKKIRGRVWGAALMGSGVGAMVLNPLVGVIMDRWGWRAAFNFFGILALALVPLVLLTYVRYPRDKGLVPIGQDETEAGGKEVIDTSGIPAARVLKSGSIWVFLLAFFLLSGGVYTWTVNGASYLGDLGYSIVTVTFYISIASIGTTVGKIILGTINDKMNVRAAMVVGSLSLGGGFLLSLLIGRFPLLAYPSMLILGIGLASTTVLGPLATREFYGNKDYSTLLGVQNAAHNLGGGLLGVFASSLYDLTGSYVVSWVTAFAMSVGTLVLLNVSYVFRNRLVKKYWQAE
ncbi:MAG: nitrate/nitrite transporter [Oscillospiraceae bacterium]